MADRRGLIGRLSHWNFSEPPLPPDGTGYWQFEWRDVSCVLHRYSVATGERAGTSTVFHRDESDLQAYSFDAGPGEVVIRSDGAQFAFPTGMGFEVVNLRADQSGAPEAVRVPCLDGQPQLLRYRPDGTLVTVHTGDDGIAVRTWPRWDLRAKTIDYEFPVFSPDRTTVAALAVDPDPDGSSSDWDRMRRQRRFLVTAADGRVLYSSDCSPALCVETQTFRGEIPYGYSADGRSLFVLQRCRTASGFVHRILIRDLHGQKDHARLESAPGTFVKSVQVNASGDRLLVCVGEGPAEGPRQMQQKMLRAEVYEFPTGRFLWKLEPNSGDSLGFVGDTIRNHATGAEWDGKTGASLGARPSTTASPMGGEQVAGSHRLKLFYQSERRENRAGFHTELWATDRPGEDARLVLRIQQDRGPHAAYLSPDGTRLLRYTPFANRGRSWDDRELIVHCTTTGRPLLTLPDNFRGDTANRFRAGAVWSPDGTQFWVRLDRDGKPEGVDFRPHVSSAK